MSGHRSTRILVIRHGQSTWNAQGRWQGQADPPLSALGELQAMQAAEYLVAPDAVWSSDLQRAVLTASIIAAELGHDPVALDPRLRERHAGAWQGLTRDEVESGWPGYLASGRRPAGFEPSDSAGRRALACLVAAARRLEGATALVVSHGGILRAMRKVLGAHEDIGFANLSGEWFAVDGSTVVAGELVSLLPGDRPVQSSPL